MVTEAVEQFLKEGTVRNLAATTITKRRELLEGKLLPFCARRGHRQLRELTVERLREFRHGWSYSPLSAAKRLEYLRAFLRFCVEAGWIERNPAAALKPTKVPHRPTLPYTDGEVDRLIEAARSLLDFGRYGPRIEPTVSFAPQGCVSRQRLEVARPQLDQDHRAALCALGQSAPGATRERGPPHVAIMNRPSRDTRLGEASLTIPTLRYPVVSSQRGRSPAISDRDAS